ncbi:MAG: bifunctional folylpolyglutamate synthase/dihydrofolate synthase [Bacteroidaceae bacterium]|nr:bifunctional folylpolyglutamate synthase/dihydrofolate synthase [Bacteroidaceae bacterium]
MTYKETTDYLFNSAPLFQNIGAGAYKEGLYNTHKLDEYFGHPHRKFKTIHVAGTNGKGSCSHTIAAILQASGLKVGLFTSPHLVDFRERIRINGEMIDEQSVIDFVEQHRPFFEPLHPSFFEITTALAFKYFADQHIDIAVVEVGLGGRLDCTNIITPEISIITNISFDHVQFLGDTLAKIASEKAGIIKTDIPVVIGEYNEETKPVFTSKADDVKAPIFFAEDDKEVLDYTFNNNNHIGYNTKTYGNIIGELGGYCQTKNTNTILCAVKQLQKQGFGINNEHIKKGFANVCELTGLMGRWQKVGTSPEVVCDTGHNIGGFEWIAKQLNGIRKPLRIVFGMVNDKDITGVISMLPKNAQYYFCQASVKRALPHSEIKRISYSFGLKGDSYPSVGEAYHEALSDSTADDFIYVGGSSFVVADFLTILGKEKNDCV